MEASNYEREKERKVMPTVTFFLISVNSLITR